MGQPILNICIEIGLSYSGFSYMFRHDRKVYTSEFTVYGYLSTKTPTAILLNSNKDLIAFGYEAEVMYSELVEKEEQNDYFYINDTKSLYHEDFTLPVTLRDVSGKTFDASVVISQVLGYMKKECTRQLTGISSGLNAEKDSSFVVLVPATSTDNLIRFFKESMEKTGTSKDRICIVSDAVAAYVHFNSKENYRLEDKRNENVLVIDAGEECKLTVLETRAKSEVVQKATGTIPWGGKSVNNAFLGMLSSVFSQSVMDTLKNEKLDDYYDLLREFAIKKTQTLDHQRKEFIRLHVPRSLTELVLMKHQKMECAIEKSQYKDVLSYARGKLHIQHGFFPNLFKETNDNIEQFVQSVLHNPKLTKITTVLLAGGFAECKLLQNRLLTIVGESAKLIIPESPELVPLSGGAMYGFAPIKVNAMASDIINLSPTAANKTHEEAQTSAQTCVSCDGEGKFYCYECSSIYCGNCKKTHEKIPATKSHTVTDLKKADVSAKTIALCITHKNHFVYACNDCSVLLCSQCVTTSHSGHKILDMNSVVNKSREELTALLPDLKSGLLKLKSDVANIRSMDISGPAHEGKEEIKAIKKQIDDVVQRHVSFRFNEVDDVLQMQQEEIQYELSRKERVLGKQETLVTSLERLLEDKHDVSFFTAYKVLKEEIVDVNDVIGNPLTSEIRDLDRRVFVETTINDIISSFGYSPVDITDGRVVLQTHQTDTKRKK